MCMLMSLYFFTNGYMVALVFILTPLLFLLIFRYFLLCIRNLPAVSFKNFWFVFVLFLIMSTSLFDNTMTFIKNPDLSREANIIVVTLLEHNVPVNIVTFIFILFQSMIIILMMLYWVLSYKSMPIIIENLKNDDVWKKILKIHSIRKFSVKNILFSMDEPLYTNAFLGFNMTSVCVSRICCGLDWLGWITFSGWVVTASSLLLTNLIYVTYLLYCSRKSIASDMLGNIR